MTDYARYTNISEIECFIEPVFSSGNKNSTSSGSHNACLECSCGGTTFSQHEGHNAAVTNG